MNVLVLNCGSSSVKFQLIETDLDIIKKNADRTLARGLIERLFGESKICFQVEGHDKIKFEHPLPDHKAAIEFILKWITSPDSHISHINSLSDIDAVGHRVVHGAEQFTMSVKLDGTVIKKIEDCCELAPLHNPANLKGIQAAMEIFGPDTPQVAVFDTSFHTSMPEVSYLYAIPYELYTRHRIRRYGFHGTSHRYVAYRYRLLTGRNEEQTNVITMHLGNGCSACAIKKGRSFDTSMGFTPLEGLVMGTRCGDIDPSLIEFIRMKEGLSVQEIDTILNKKSGLLGISGLTNDMRDLLDSEKEIQHKRATLAIDIFCERVKKYIGAYLARLGGADAVIFTGGIGENSPQIRERICNGLEWMGLTIDKKVNDVMVAGKEGDVTTSDSRLKAFVIPTNEELLIARDTVRTVKNEPRRF